MSAPPPRRIIVDLGATCSNRCVFCSDAGTPRPAQTDAKQVHETLRVAGEREAAVLFVGGEPGLHEGLTHWVGLAKSLGVSRIGVQTNGAGLGARIEALADAGLDELHVTLLGGTDAIHDYHTRTPGSFATLDATLSAWTATERLAVASTVLTRSNFRSLAPLAIWLRARRVQAWRLVVPRIAGELATTFDRVVPRLGMAIPYALHAASTASSRGLPTALEGAPHCLLGPHANLVANAPPRAFAPRCEGCRARSNCSGVDEVYLERFSAEELRPVDAPKVAGWTGVPPHLRSLFVDTVHRTGVSMSPPPSAAAARKRLPVLGRPAPASAEVRKRSEVTDSARQLFPDLFEDEPS